MAYIFCGILKNVYHSLVAYKEKKHVNEEKNGTLWQINDILAISVMS